MNRTVKINDQAHPNGKGTDGVPEPSNQSKEPYIKQQCHRLRKWERLDWGCINLDLDNLAFLLISQCHD